MKIFLTDKEFDNLERKLKKIDRKDSFLPTEEELKRYSEEDPERYLLFFWWIIENPPQDLNDEERGRLKKIRSFVNRHIVIEEPSKCDKDKKKTINGREEQDSLKLLEEIRKACERP